MIPAFDIDSDATIWFDSENGRINTNQNNQLKNTEFSENEKLKLDPKDVTYKDAVFASTTNPNLWSSSMFPIPDQDNHRFIDGGEGSEHLNNNNPTKSLIIEAMRQGYSRDQINVISLGTGTIGWNTDSENKDPPTDDQKNFDEKMYWKNALHNKLIGKESDCTHEQVLKMINPENYVRF